MDTVDNNPTDGNGDNPTRLTNTVADFSTAWSPDGSKIAFVSYRGEGDAEIYTMKPRPEGRKNRPKTSPRTMG